jgi:predicted esterase
MPKNRHIHAGHSLPLGRQFVDAPGWPATMGNRSRTGAASSATVNTPRRFAALTHSEVNSNRVASGRGTGMQGRFRLCKPEAESPAGSCARLPRSAWRTAIVRRSKSIACTMGIAVGALLASGVLSARADDTIILKDGREIVGRVGVLTSMAENPKKPPSDDAVQGIVFVDNNLTRTSFPKLQIREVKNGGGPNFEVIFLKQSVCQAGNRIASVGPILRVDPFDGFGRRIFSMRADNKEGRFDIIQGITAIHPLWTRVESLNQGNGPQLVWDMRIATSSIPRDTLSKLLANQISRKNADDRLKVVRLYLNSERYSDAQAELQAVIADFPELASLKDEQKAIRQLGARRALDEIALRYKAGQHRLAQLLLSKFPTEDVAGAVLQEVKARQEEYAAQVALIAQTKKQLAELVTKIDDTFLKQRVGMCVAEIDRELNFTTLDRMTAFRQFLDSPNLDAGKKASLALSGWLLGGNDATDNLSLSLSMYNVRKIVCDYLAEPIELKRNYIFNSLASEEAGSPKYIAKIIAKMKPPVATPPQETTEAVDAKASPNAAPGAAAHAGAAVAPAVKAVAGTGAYALSVQGLAGERPINYLVQLPPEYDPFRRYPAIVTLNGSGTTPTQQINWWAGEPNDSGVRLGQASRHGYIVIAPDWTKKGQVAYQFEAREHAAVLNSLRDACRRFSIDTDRVFLSGHSMGGDAAWDIGIAHPDVWAGVIPITATADRYISHYTANAKYVPLYFVCGELDGDRMVKNARDLDRYMMKPGYNVTVVEYLGRGHEHFYDEIQNLFAFMAKQERNFFPNNFTTTTMRAWDNFFWWVEVGDLPPSATVNPTEWPPPRTAKAVSTTAKLIATKEGSQTINISSGAGAITIWLAPEMVDFGRRIKIVAKGQTVYGNQPSPDARVLLDDVLWRGDRQHPFWARINVGGAAAGGGKAAKTPASPKR